ncbi:hypothetical protein [Myxococcus stipitatus]|uniref:hypothetical protein n=1 Tax=Myxococcus stipitatus TaxID=83455 RepID=UPI0030CF3F6D
MALQSWRIAQGTHHAESDVYDPVFAKVDFPMQRGNRYTYFAGRGPVELRDTTPSVGADTATVIGADTEFLKQQKDSTESLVSFEQLPPGVQAVLGMTGTCPQCQISAACAANLDDDDTLDVWVISTGPLPLNHADGKPSEPDSVIHVVDDHLD